MAARPSASRSGSLLGGRVGVLLKVERGLFAFVRVDVVVDRGPEDLGRLGAEVVLEDRVDVDKAVSEDEASAEGTL